MGVSWGERGKGGEGWDGVGCVADVIPGRPGRGAKGGLFVSTTRAPATVRASTPMDIGGGGGVVRWIEAGLVGGASARQVTGGGETGHLGVTDFLWRFLQRFSVRRHRPPQCQVGGRVV